MKMPKLREMTDEELRQRMTDTREELFNLRIQRSTGRIERPVRMRLLRRDTARVLTLMKQRGIH